MRFLTASENKEADLYVIVGEMINFMTNVCYYKDGKLVDRLIREYNTYTIDNIAYNIKTNTGIVFYLCNEKITYNLYTLFNNVFQIMVMNAKKKFGPIIMQHYISKDSRFMYEYFEYELDPNEHDYINSKHQKHIFNWELLNESKFKYGAEERRCYPYSFNCITYHKNYFTVEHDQILTRMITNDDLIVIKNNTILYESLSYDPYYGIIKNFNYDCSKITLKYAIPSDIPWIKWESIIPLKNTSSRSYIRSSYMYHILDTNKKEYYKIPRDNNIITCFITGAPIYGLCYVIVYYKLNKLIDPISIIITPYAFDAYVNSITSAYKYVVYKSFSPITCENKIMEYYAKNPVKLLLLTKLNQAIDINRIVSPEMYIFDDYCIMPNNGYILLEQTNKLKNKTIYFNY